MWTRHDEGFMELVEKGYNHNLWKLPMAGPTSTGEDYPITSTSTGILAYFLKKNIIHEILHDGNWVADKQSIVESSIDYLKSLYCGNISMVNPYEMLDVIPSNRKL
ncbi:hypothetical protein LIER_40879 [Lithospermum erythrorhizon]|uniref:Uncharacterized protein n=1 Tax=Lithospermum erythrorhizon TaxID=34254 RepID=A0AAV3R0W2_LITER